MNTLINLFLFNQCVCRLHQHLSMQPLRIDLTCDSLGRHGNLASTQNLSHIGQHRCRASQHLRTQPRSIDLPNTRQHLLNNLLPLREHTSLNQRVRDFHKRRSPLPRSIDLPCKPLSRNSHLTSTQNLSHIGQHRCRASQYLRTQPRFTNFPDIEPQLFHNLTTFPNQALRTISTHYA